MTNARRVRTTSLVAALAAMVLVVGGCSGGSSTRARPVPASQRPVDWTRLAHADLEIFMTVDATANQITTVRDALLHDRDVAHFAFLTKSSAYTEFGRLTGPCEPELLNGISPADLPTSFRVATVRDAHVRSVAARYRATPGVKTVVVAPVRPTTTSTEPCPPSTTGGG